jgi:prepilin-type N-terminal cleavage/methylation domain-containing protein
MLVDGSSCSHLSPAAPYCQLMLKSHYQTRNFITREKGFSLIELMIVLLIISILSVMAVISFRAEKKYYADTQAFQIIDILHEARQRSITQHETMRVEFNQTRNVVRLFSENEPGDASDDKEIKTFKLMDTATVAVGTEPKNISKKPSEIAPTPVLSFKKSVYPLSLSDSVITLRFVPKGKVLDAGSNSIGNNAAMTGATIYVWMPDYSSSGQPQETGSIIRAVTVQGTSGLTKYWKCQLVKGNCENWVQ